MKSNFYTIPEIKLLLSETLTDGTFPLILLLLYTTSVNFKEAFQFSQIVVGQQTTSNRPKHIRSRFYTN